MTEAIPPKPPARKDLTEEAVELAAVVATGLTSCLGVTGMDTCSDDIVEKSGKERYNNQERDKGGELPYLKQAE